MRYAILLPLSLALGLAVLSTGCSKSNGPTGPAAADIKPVAKPDAKAARSVGVNRTPVD